MKDLKIILLSFMLLCTGTLFAQNYNVNLTANGGKTVVYAEPDDEITFEISENIPGPTTRNVFFLDYVNINWQDGHKWKATPGIHMVRRYIRWLANTPTSVVEDNDATQDFMHKWVVIIVEDPNGVNLDEFRHPGLEATASQLEQIQQNVLINGHPMRTAWQSFRNTANGYLNYTPNGMDTLNMAGFNKVYRNQWDKDGKALYRLSLAWAISGDNRYADKAIEILNDWSYKNKALRTTYTSQYAFLHQTHCYGLWINGAELLRYYKGKNNVSSGWSDVDIAQWDKYFREVFAPMTMGWGGHGNGVWGGQNQNLNVYKSRMMAAIHANNRGMFDAASYLMFTNQRAFAENQAVHGKATITYVEQSIGSVNHFGEVMEISRNDVTKPDWGHASMCTSTITQMANFLWHQKGYINENDFYGLVIDNNPKPRLLHMIDWLTDFSITGGPYTKQQFESDGDAVNSIGTIVTNGTGAIRSKYNQKVIARTDRYTAWAQQYYNHYNYVMGNVNPISVGWANVAQNGGGSVNDRLLFSRLNDGWVDPDTLKVTVDQNTKATISINPSSNISEGEGVIVTFGGTSDGTIISSIVKLDGAIQNWTSGSTWVAVAGQHTFQVTVTDDKGGMVTKSVTVTVAPITTVVDLNEIDFTIYPNPTADVFHVTGNNIDKVTVINTLGKNLNTYSVNGTELQIDLSSQPSGVYFIKILSGDKGVVKKIIKK